MKTIVNVDSILADNTWLESTAHRCVAMRHSSERDNYLVPRDIYRAERPCLNRNEIINFYPSSSPMLSLEGVDKTVSVGKPADIKVRMLVVASALAFAASVYQFLSNGPLLLPVAVFVFSFFQALIAHRNQ